MASLQRTLSISVIFTYIILHAARCGDLFSFNGLIQLPNKGDEQHSVKLPFDLILFNSKLRKGTELWVSMHGLVSINQVVYGYNKETLPFINTTEDPVVLAPYRARAEYRPDESDEYASVSYTFDITGPSLEKITQLIRSDSTNKDFQPDKGFAVNWNNVSFYGGTPDAIPYPRNTFQLVTVTDNSKTFVIYNYKQIVWDGGFSSGGDPNTGVGASKPPAQAGLNLGNGKGFIKVLEGVNASILDLDQIMSKEGEVGLFIFEASSQEPVLQGCIPDQTYSGSGRLYTYPTSGPMTGGNPVHISGFCFEPDEKYTCKFDDIEVTAQFIGRSKILCYAPIFYANKKVKVTIYRGGILIPSSDTYYLTSILVPNKLTLINLSNWRSAEPSDDLQLEWNPFDLSHYSGSLTLKLMYYYENNTYYGWNEELIIAENVPNNGRFNFSAQMFKCETRCQDKSTGAVVLELKNPTDKLHPGRLWTNVGPLGWYIRDDMKSRMGELWADKSCYNWFQQEKSSDSNEGLDWVNELQDCPCTVDQAIADIGRFIPDPGCNLYLERSDTTCYYHKQAVHCVRSIWPSYPTGAGTQCCYADDGNLIYAGDSTMGSTVDKSHNLGAAPYDQTGYVPSLSHWIRDVTTFQFCCLWNSLNTTCGIYMDLRPTKDCNKYQTVRVAGVYGFLHQVTFSRLKYSFTTQEVGDYLLLKASQDVGGAVVHGRFQHLDSISTLPTMTGIVVKEDNTPTIELTINERGQLLKSTLRIDHFEQKFTEKEWFTQEYNGFTIMSWNLEPITDHSNFTVTFKSGLGLQISVFHWGLNVVVSIPTKFKNQMSDGLLGNWSDNSPSLPDIDTLKLRSGYSLFTTEFDANNLISTEFNPSDYDSSKLAEVCSGVSQCEMDYQMTGSTTAAEWTMKFDQWLLTLRSYADDVSSCGMPVYHGIRNGTNYLVGSQTQVIGCRYGYKLEGETPVHTCLPGGTWDPPVNETCTYVGFPELVDKGEATPRSHSSDTSQFDEKMIIIIVTCLVALVLIVIALGVFMYFRNKRKNKGNEIDDTDLSEEHYGMDTHNPAYTLSTNGSTGSITTQTKHDHVNNPPSYELYAEIKEGRMNTYRLATDPTADQIDDFKNSRASNDRLSSIASSSNQEFYSTYSRSQRGSRNSQL